MADRVLVVDDEEGIRAFLREALASEGIAVTEAADGQVALDLLAQRTFHLMITDLKMPRLGGMELLRRAREAVPEMEVIVLTAYGTVDNAVEAMKWGAFDYLTKPLSGPAELRLLVARALERRRLRLHEQEAAIRAEDAAAMIAEDPATRAVVEQLRRVAPTGATVLISGESGTGKEVAARFVHALSGRAEGAFVPVNCAAISPQLVESEIFGHEKGAFTGAAERRRGRFELADGGTLFLDEVGELPAALQAKLLRVLQEQRFERVGGTRTIDVDARVIAATNRDLGAEIRAGRFREDLFHRLAVFPVHLPPLRERPGDLRPLAMHVLAGLARRLGRGRLRLSEEAMAVLVEHAWPGNVRELGNALERAAILTDGEVIEPGALLLGAPTTNPIAEGLDGTLKDIEARAIRRALIATGGHRRRAAERLGLGLRTLYEKLKAYGIE